MLGETLGRAALSPRRVRSVSARSPRRSTGFSTIEQLEGRQMMAAQISGTVFNDITGNSITKDDKGASAVVVNLYKDVNANGKLDAADGVAVASTKTNSAGKYSFSKLAVGTYFVEETVPTNAVRTSPYLDSAIKVDVTNKNGNYKNNDFANYYKTFDKNAVKNVTYVINGTKTVTTLKDNVAQGDVVEVKFTLTSKQTVSLVSYKTTDVSGDPLSEQTVYDKVTATLCAGTYCMRVRVPNCYFQIDFVGGKVIDQFGPRGGNANYTNQGRLIDSDKGGTNACTDCGPKKDNDCKDRDKDKCDDRDRDKDKDKCDDKDKDKGKGSTWCNFFVWVKKCFIAKKADC